MIREAIAVSRVLLAGRGLRRGDELVSVNGKCQFHLMCKVGFRQYKACIEVGEMKVMRRGKACHKNCVLHCFACQNHVL